MLVAFGAVQFIGGVMMIFAQTRFWGAALVAITFAVSLVHLIAEGNVAFTIATLVALVLLGAVLLRSRAA